jgi:hypothetical protein
MNTDERHLMFHDVLCTPSFTVNLLFVPRLDDLGYTVVHG